MFELVIFNANNDRYKDGSKQSDYLKVRQLSVLNNQKDVEDRKKMVQIYI